MSLKRILVTGASSPLGRAVGRRLQREGVVSVGTIRSATKPGDLPMFDELAVVDFNDLSTLRNIYGDFEAVIHVAAASYGAPADLMRVTGIATDFLARVAINLGIRRFVHVSAMSVYGRPEVSVVSSKTPIKHSIPYGAAKWAAECYLHDLQDQMPSISIRSPAIVGSRPGTHTHFLAKVLKAMTTRTETIRLSNPDFLFNNIVHEETLSEFLVHLSLSSLVGYQAIPVGSIQADKLKDLINYMANAVEYTRTVSWDNGSESPFSIDFREAIELGFQPLTSMRVLEQWLAPQTQK